QQERNLAVIFITHDLAVASHMADKLIVMQKGEVVEQGSKEEIFKSPKHEYTKKLLSSVLDSPKPQIYQMEMARKPLIKAKNINTWFPQYSVGLFKRISGYIKGVDNISIDIFPGEIVGLVGESGSGKSTLGRSLIRLIEPKSGSVDFEGKEVLSLDRNTL